MPVTNFFWDGDNLLQEYNEAGAATAQYSTEPGSFGSITSQRRSGQSHYYHHDPIGSTTELTDPSGNVSDTRRYTAFGEIVEQSGATIFPFQYIGQAGYYFDPERGTHYVRRRDYDTIDGRWLSADPQPTNGGNGEYTYASNCPLTHIDPSGRHAFLCQRSYNDVMRSSGRDPDTGERRSAVFLVSWQVGVVEGRCGIISDREGVFELSVSITPLRVGVCDPGARAVLSEMHNLFMYIEPRILDDSRATMNQGEANRLCSARSGPPAIIDGCRGINYTVDCNLPCGPARTCGLIGAAVRFAVYERYGTGGARPLWEGREVSGMVSGFRCGDFFSCPCNCEMDACGVTSRELLTRVLESDLPTREPIIV